MRPLLLVITIALSACGVTQETIFATIGEEMTPEPTATATAPAAGIDRLCEAFDIVTGDISPAYESIAADTAETNLWTQGLAIMTAGARITELADGVDEPGFVEILERMGAGFIAEGEAVADGDLGGSDAISYYLDQVVEYGQDCP